MRSNRLNLKLIAFSKTIPLYFFITLYKAEIPTILLWLGFCCLFGISVIVYLCLSFRYYRNIAFVLAALAKVHNTVDKCEERIVFTDAHVLAGVVFRATLTNDDVTSSNLLSAINLNAKSL